MCLYPKLIRNKKYIPNKKNGGQVPPIFDKRVLAVPRACGRCMECRKKNSREWQVRLLEDVRHNKNGKFITLTFSNASVKEITSLIDVGIQGYERDNEIATIAVRRFLERWRKEHKKSLRHWLVTELGHNGTENIHLHGLVWTDQDLNEVEKHWKYGYVWKGKGEKKENYVNERTVNYITKYINKIDAKHTEYKPKILTSAGIGKGYTTRIDAEKNKYKEGQETKEYYRTRTGHKIGMPIYWRNKIYTDEEREKLWIKKLDEQVRWVNRIKIDISKGEEEYYEILKYQRTENRRLGYQDDEINWNKKKYEEDRRNMLTQARINNKTVEEMKQEYEIQQWKIVTEWKEE